VRRPHRHGARGDCARCGAPHRTLRGAHVSRCPLARGHGWRAAAGAAGAAPAAGAAGAAAWSLAATAARERAQQLPGAHMALCASVRMPAGHVLPRAMLRPCRYDYGAEYICDFWNGACLCGRVREQACAVPKGAVTGTVTVTVTGAGADAGAGVGAG
jgi:hypothetical protein